ncbi:MAG: hypothetical protein AAGF74_16685 [Pseudomonadota bacterium]
MPTVYFRNTGPGVSNQLTSPHYRLETISERGAGFVFQSGAAAYDAADGPWQVELTFQGANGYVLEQGPNSGDLFFTSGKIVSYRFLGDDGEEWLLADGLAASLPKFSASLAVGAPLDALLEGLVTGKTVFSGRATPELSDDIWTASGSDTVQGRGGDDTFRDAGGRDTYKGGAGFDTLDYSGNMATKQGIVARLDKRSVTGPDEKTDSLKSVEAIGGTAQKDRFTGDRESNTFYGFQGSDRMDGKGGYDEVDHRFDADFGGTSGIIADLAAGRVRDGFGTTDRITKIEGVVGTAFADTFFDNGANNYFFAGQGADLVFLGSGNDVVNLASDAGETDTIVFRGENFGTNTVYGFGAEDLLDIDLASALSDLTISQQGNDAHIAFMDSRIVLIDVTAADLTAETFGF